MIDVFVLGEIILDITVKDFACEMHHRKGTLMKEAAVLSGGGDAQNASSTMGRLGLDVKLVGRVGDDYAGRLCLDMTGKAGVDTSNVIVTPDGDTATSVNLVQCGGEASFLTFHGVNYDVTVDDMPYDLFSQAKFVNLHSLFSLPNLDIVTVFGKAKECGAKTFADTTGDPGDTTIDDLSDFLERTDYFVPSYDELSMLTGMTDPKDMLRLLLKKGVGTALCKLGKDGVMVADSEGITHLPTYDGPVINTTGNGDNFSAAVTYGLCKGYGIRDCCRLGNAAGTINSGSITSNGAVKSFEQLRDLIYRQEGRML